MSSSTADFIEKVSMKLGRPTPQHPPAKTDVLIPQYTAKNEKEIIETFIKAWENLGGKVGIVKSAKEVQDTLIKWFGDQPDWLGHHSIVAWEDLPLIAKDAFSNRNWPLRVYSNLPQEKSDRTAAAAQAYMGITGADWGLARSGSIVLKSGKGRGRAVSLVPPCHLSFIKASNIFYDLRELFEELGSRDNPPAALEIISGPSRTSDIEMDLSIGVHGPIEVFTMVILEQ